MFSFFRLNSQVEAKNMDEIKEKGKNMKIRQSQLKDREREISTDESHSLRLHVYLLAGTGMLMFMYILCMMKVYHLNSIISFNFRFLGFLLPKKTFNHVPFTYSSS